MTSKRVSSKRDLKACGSKMGPYIGLAVIHVPWGSLTACGTKVEHFLITCKESHCMWDQSGVFLNYVWGVVLLPALFFVCKFTLHHKETFTIRKHSP